MPYGSWPSPIRIDDLVGDVVRLGEPWIDGDDVYWLEGRPAEGGRQVLVRREADGTTADLTPPPFDVRTRVHEYGGGAYTVAGGDRRLLERRDGRLYRLDPGVDAPAPITPEGPWRYADLRFDPARRRFLAVREDHARRRRARRRRSSPSPLDGDRPTRPSSYEGPDFLAAPRPSPDGTPLAWLEWDHPDMPWDATRLRVATIARRRLARPSRTWPPAGPTSRSPSRTGRPTASSTSSATGAAGGTSTAWSRGRGSSRSPRWRPSSPTRPGCSAARRTRSCRTARSSPSAARDGRDRLSTSTPGGLVGEVETPFTEFDGLRSGRRAGRRGRRRLADRVAVVVALDPATLAPTGVLRRSTTPRSTRRSISVPESIAFPTTGGRDGARPVLPADEPGRHRRPTASCPPLIVLSHGGPTANASTALDLDDPAADQPRHRRRRRRLRRQHRLRPRLPPALDGEWGVVDVDDCVGGRALPRRPRATSTATAWRSRAAAPAATRRSPRSPSATRSPPGISLFGIGDLETLARDTHKFESRYMDRLVGPYPAMADRYRAALADPLPRRDRRARSSSSRASRTGSCRRPRPRRSSPRSPPTASRTPTCAFEGEGHGFRGAAAHAAHARGAARVPRRGLRVQPADELEPLELPGLEAWRARRARIAVAGLTRRLPRTPTATDVDPIAHRDPRPDRARLPAARRRRSALAYLARRLGIAEPILLRARRPRPRVRSRTCRARSSSSRTSSSCCSCRRSCSPPAYFTPIRDFQANVRPILLLAIGLVLFTTVVVGVVARRSIPELGWRGRVRPSGAIVAPPDAVAATADLPAPGRPAPDRHDPRGREPHQRRVGAHRLPRRVGRRARPDRRSRCVDATRRRSSSSASAASPSAWSSALIVTARAVPDRPTRSSRSSSRCSPRSRPTSRPRSSACRACWPRSSPA